VNPTRLVLLIGVAASLALAPTLRADPQQPGPAPQQQPSRLEPGRTIERDISARQVDTFLIALDSGAMVKVAVTQRGIDLVVSIYGPLGGKLAEVDSSADGPEQEARAVVVRTGEHRIEIRAFDTTAAAGRYSLTAQVVSREQLAALAAADRARLAASPWNVNGIQTGEYEVALDSSVAHGGRTSARITGRFAHAMIVAWVGQPIRADTYRGKRVRLTAWMKVANVRGIGAFVDISADGGFAGPVPDAVPDAPPLLGSSDWVLVGTEFVVPPTALILRLRPSLDGSGTVWIDDVSLVPLRDEAVAPAPAGLAAPAPSRTLLSLYASLPDTPDSPGFEGAGLNFPDQFAGVHPGPFEPPRATTPRGLDNLVAFAHLFGIVRHFVAMEEVRTANWDDFAISAVRRVESATNPGSLASTLQSIFGAVAPGVRVYPTGGAPPTYMAAVDTGRAAGIAWRVNTGISLGSTGATVYHSWLFVYPAPGLVLPDLGSQFPPPPDPAQPWRGSLGAGVSAIVPLARWVEITAADSLRRRPVQPAGASEAASPNDRATRLAGVVVGWNVLQHAYPYFDLVHTDWNAALRAALESSATDSTPNDYRVTLERMMAALKDGHGRVANAYGPQRRAVCLPVRFDWVEGQLVVDAVAPGAPDGVRRGDVIVSVNGIPTDSALREQERRISGATAQWIRVRALAGLEWGPAGSPVLLRVRPATGGVARDVRVAYQLATQVEPDRPDKIAEVRPGIFYVDLGRITDADFTAALPNLVSARGIVFDMRGYPGSVSTLDILSRLASDTIHSAHFLLPTFSQPFMADATWWDGWWTLPPKTPHIGGKIAFLTGGGAISYAESTMGIVEQYNLGEIVGSTTAGTNGNVNLFDVPGGFRLVFTGMKVTKLDNSPHHGVGIRPTVPVSRTLKGVAEGRDEVLEAGIAVVSGTRR
jgi:C-terminal processing protease CtpA/Prc